MTAKIKGLFRRGRVWWLRYTPSPGALQIRESLDTSIEQVAVMRAVEKMQRAPLIAAAEEWERDLDIYFEDRVRLKRLSPYCARNRRIVLTNFARDTAVSQAGELSVKLVEEWVQMLKGGRRPLADITIVSYLTALRSFCRWLVAKGKLADNPAAKVELGKIVPTGRRNFVAAADVRRVIEAAQTDELRFILFCGFHCGMRKMEIVEARPDWFHVGADGRGRVTVGQTATFTAKDREDRTIPLSREFAEFLRGYLARLPAGATFVLAPEKKHGKHRYRYDFRTLFDEHLKRCGVKCSVHDMRRTFVSLKLIENSSLIFKVAKWTGAGVAVLQAHYGHLLADDEDIEVGL